MTAGLSRETVAAIKGLREKGLTGYEIAARLGIGKSSAYKYIRERSYPRWTEEEKQIVISGYLRGKPIAKIAKRLGRSKSAVKSFMHNHRKAIKGDPDIKIASSLITSALRAGLPPGKAISKIRKYDVFNRAKEEAKTGAL